MCVFCVKHTVARMSFTRVARFILNYKLLQNPFFYLVKQSHHGVWTLRRNKQANKQMNKTYHIIFLAWQKTAENKRRKKGTVRRWWGQKQSNVTCKKTSCGVAVSKPCLHGDMSWCDTCRVSLENQQSCSEGKGWDRKVSLSCWQEPKNINLH